MKKLSNFHMLMQHLCCALIIAVTVGCASIKAPTEAISVMKVSWGANASPNQTKVTNLEKCTNGECVSINTKGLSVWKNDKGESTHGEVEVCQDKNPWSQQCDVYNCREDHVGLQSICTLAYSYNKSCYSDTCTN